MNGIIFNEFGHSFTIFKVIFVFAILLVTGGFIYTFLMIFNPKFRGKILSKQLKATKHMMNFSKEDLEDISNIAIQTKKNILEKNEDNLKDISNMESNIKKEYVKNIAKGIKEGLTDSDNIYCKYCGASIDYDSKYCKTCGKKL